MEQTSLSALLKADEEKLYRTLQANRSIEKSREKSLETLREELGELLLRYNAACGKDRLRQSAADCLTATARDALGLMTAAEIDKETTPRRVQARGSLGLLAAVLFAVAAVLLLDRIPLAGYGCLAGAVLCAFLGGLGWFSERETLVRPAVDPDAAWQSLKKTVDTMDRKLEEFSAQAQVWAGEKPSTASQAPLSPEELALYSDLLEALYAENGDYALRQLKKLRPYLRSRGVELVDYSPAQRELFELFPSKRPGLTQRPALMAGKKLLQIGRATEMTGREEA